MGPTGIKYPPLRQPGDIEPWNGTRSFLFTISEFTSYDPLYDIALALYVNPNSLDETMTKSKTVSMTYGGFVEFHWPEELDSISAQQSTGGFLSPDFGYTAAPSRKDSGTGILSGRRGTLAYERFMDFLELFRNNGIIYDGKGSPVLRGRVIMMYDRGSFLGHFTSFEITEEDTMPFSFNLTWEFKVEKTIYIHNSSFRR